ncbi:MAG TPA: DUF2752 domain-containing protein [Acidimicrobiales bacterium]|nr:DUF2752 domain-containing protein [Acidimicrobiales bacterium]
MRDSTVLSPLVVTAQPGLNRAAAGPAVLALAAVSAASVTALVNPFEHHLSPPCPFHALTGLWCPFCGGTRAVWALAHGDFRLMLHADALFPLIAAAAVWGWLAWLGRVTGWWRLPMPRGRATAVVAVGLLVAFTVVRNLAGFGLLAPPASS